MNKVLYKKSSERRIAEGALFWCIFAVSWILFALNTNNVDYRNYERAYNLIGQGINDGYFEFLFVVLVKIGNFIGMSYQMFFTVIATVTIFVFRRAISYFTDNMLLTYGLFLIYPFMFDVVQYRNFIAYAVCLYGLRYLFKKVVTPNDMLKYAFFVIVGTLLHLSAIIYIAFLLIIIKDSKNVAVIALTFVGVLTIFLVFPKLFTTILSSVGLEKYARYDIGNNISTFIQYIAVYIMFFTLGMISLKGDFQCKQAKLMIVILMFVPFILFNGTAARFFRNTFVLFYAIILNNTPVLVGSKLKLKNFIMVFALCATVIFVFIMQLGSGLYFETVLKPVIKNNLLF